MAGGPVRCGTGCLVTWTFSDSVAISMITGPTKAALFILPSGTPAPTVTERELISVDNFPFPKQPWAVYCKYCTLVRFYWSLFPRHPLSPPTPASFLFVCHLEAANAAPLAFLHTRGSGNIYSGRERTFLLSLQPWYSLVLGPRESQMQNKGSCPLHARRGVQLSPKCKVWEAPPLAIWDMATRELPEVSKNGMVSL